MMYNHYTLQLGYSIVHASRTIYISVPSTQATYLKHYQTSFRHAHGHNAHG
jgi:hypothetical protein